MGIESVGGQVRFLSDVEPWMRDQWSTEVFNFSTAPYGNDEMEITEILDSVLFELVFGRSGIDNMVERAKAHPKRFIQGRQAKKGEQSLASWQGSNFDEAFKRQVETELGGGRLSQFQNRLRVIPGGEQGPDVFLESSPLIAWDVTTQADIERHIMRDAIGGIKRRVRLFDRYYLLIWDEPRTKPNTLLKALTLRSRS